MAELKTFPCPKCNRRLTQSGELVVLHGVLPTYQCDECLVTVDLAGEPVEMALTFAVTAAGAAIDPADPEGKLRW